MGRGDFRQGILSYHVKIGGFCRGGGGGGILSYIRDCDIPKTSESDDSLTLVYSA